MMIVCERTKLRIILIKKLDDKKVFKKKKPTTHIEETFTMQRMWN
jgi:hypothetical protein